MNKKEINKKIWRKSQFSVCVKVRKKQLLWIKENKKTKTIAGTLDTIINFYKKYGNETIQNMQEK